MKIAESDSGKTIKIATGDYIKYVLHQKDDSPLYLFQSSFNEVSGTKDILKRYKVPKYFNKDFFDLVSYLTLHSRIISILYYL